jgi:hypothetical protein
VSSIALRPRSIGEILDAAFQLYRSRFVGLVLIAVVGMAPVSLVSSWFWLAVLSPEGTSTAADIGLGLAGLLALIPLALVYGALTHAAARVADGRDVRIGEAYASSARRFPALLGAGFVSFLLAAVTVVGLSIATFLVVTVVALLAGSVGGELGAGVGALGGGLAAVLLFLLGLALLAASLFAVLPLVVLDGQGPIASVRRSFVLSRGGRLKIAAVLLVAWLIIILPTMGLPMMLAGPAAMFDPAAGANMTGAQLVLQGMASFLASILTTPFLVACLVLLYYDRRVATEALDLERAVDSLDGRA